MYINYSQNLPAVARKRVLKLCIPHNHDASGSAAITKDASEEHGYGGRVCLKCLQFSHYKYFNILRSFLSSSQGDTPSSCASELIRKPVFRSFIPTEINLNQTQKKKKHLSEFLYIS